MKKLAFTLALCIALPLAMMSEDHDVKKLFNKYKDQKGFELEFSDPNINMDFDEEWDFGDFLENVNAIYVLEFEKNKGTAENLTAFKSKLEKLIDKKSYQTLIDIEGDGSVRILSRKDGNGKTTDYLVITEEDDEALFILASTD